MKLVLSIPLVGSRLARVLLALAVPLAITGCGGGTYAAGGIVGTGNVPIAAIGTITAFGVDSVVLTGQEFALSGATITVNDQSAGPSALKIGMVVTVQADTRPDGSKIAHSVSYRADARGVVDGIDATAKTFSVLGQRVPVTGLTVFDGGTFATLVSQYVEVSGYRTAPDELVATRVEIRPSFVPGVTPLEVTGTVASLDTVKRTFVLGTQAIDFSSLAAGQVPAGLVDGVTVKTTGTSVSTSGALIAVSIDIIASTPLAPAGAALELEGYVSQFASLASFRVNGQIVDATRASAEGGSLDMIVDGVKLEVAGRLVSGVLVASKIEFEEVPSLELDGLVESVSLIPGKMAVAGQVVTVGALTQFQDSSAAALRNFGLASIAVGDRLTVRAVHTTYGLLAQRVERRDRTAPPPSHAPAEVEGAITAFVSLADFDVAERKVNANSAAFSGGTAASLTVGVRVHVEGTLVDGVIIARSVEVLRADSTPPTEVDVHGTIESFVSVSSFRVAGQTIDASAARFAGGTAADLANGRFVEANGVISGGVLHATRIEFQNVVPPTPTIEAEGAISSFVSVSSFKIAGQPVDASGARFTHGSASELANGRRAHAVGPLVSGVVRATTIDVEDAPESHQIELEGRISGFVSVSQFTVAGRAVDASGAMVHDGTAAKLANGRRVQVKGTLVGGVVRASSLEFDD